MFHTLQPTAKEQTRINLIGALTLHPYAMCPKSILRPRRIEVTSDRKVIVKKPSNA